MDELQICETVQLTGEKIIRRKNLMQSGISENEVDRSVETWE